MNLLLIDTSIWIEFFKKRSSISVQQIEALKEIISNGEAAIIEPIRAELLSGHIKQEQKQEIILAFNELNAVDLDWNNRNTWNDIIACAEIAKNEGMPVPGIVDRMILISALNANIPIASQDQALLNLASEMKISIWNM
jgi:predicted nucleic acid-binding protein